MKDAAQVEVVAFRLARVQGEPVKDPAALPVLVKAAVPRGAEAVPADVVSLTKTKQLVAWLTTTAEGEHVTSVEVVRRVTVTVLLVPELPVCTLSFGV